jgi:precorrin-2/cobalt-factor-2 C20-methyltransferase
MITKLGTLYGIGIGPGDPDLITFKGVRLLSGCRHVVVPKAKSTAPSVALGIIRPHLNPAARIHELLFPMVTDQEELEARWNDSAQKVAEMLQTGEDVCYPTLGDALLYSTYIYLVRRLRAILPEARIVTVPGITAFSAVAALTEFAVGEGKQPVMIIPTADDLGDLNRALAGHGTVVIMKIGKRLDAVLDLLEEHGAMEGGVFVSHAGMTEEWIETDLRKLRGCGERAGYLSVILAKPNSGRKA